MRLMGYYKKAVIYPSLFVLLFCFLYPLFDNLNSDGKTLVSALIMSVISAGLYVLVMAILALTIFLNAFKSINRSLIISLLSWFLLPVSYIIFFLFQDLAARIRLDLGYGNDFVFILIMCLPFLTGLISGFIKYRRDNLTVSTT